MTLSKAGKLTLLAGLLCLLLMGFSGTSYGQVKPPIKWDVFPSPTEVITTGRSEVLGAISFYVQYGQGTVVTGNSLGGPTQLGIQFNEGVQIDNTTTTGIRVYAPKFATSGTYAIGVSVENRNIVPTPTRCQGFITLTIPAGVTLVDGDVIQLVGVRGRIDLSDGLNAGRNLTAQAQSINDPSANVFYPETVRVATSYPGMIVTAVNSDTLTLCLQPYGKDNNNTPGYYITIQEGFARAFVAKDSNNANVDLTDRTDGNGFILGQPDYSTSTAALWYNRATGTRVQIVLNTIPASVASITWPGTVTGNGGFSSFSLISSSQSFVPGTANNPTGWAWATYEYYTNNQAGQSDTAVESFNFNPLLVLSQTNQADVSSVKIGASLTGAFETISTCANPSTSPVYLQPRFVTSYLSYSGGSMTAPTIDKLSTTFGVYAVLTQCKCYLLYPYVMSTYGIGTGLQWNTGISVANTSEDAAVFGTAGAPKQTGPVYFYFYDRNLGYVGTTGALGNVSYGKSYITNLSQLLALLTTIPGITGTGVGQVPAPAVDAFAAAGATYVANSGFQGYMIVRADFQFCHGYAFVADKDFANIAQGYIANVIPDPMIRGKRNPSASADITKFPAGEGLNN